MMQVHLQTKTTLISVNPMSDEDIDGVKAKQIAEFVDRATKNLENFVNELLAAEELLNDETIQEYREETEG